MRILNPKCICDGSGLYMVGRDEVYCACDSGQALDLAESGVGPEEAIRPYRDNILR